jgi:DNA-directed RNA polymerase specialized sigma24 family protein
MRWDATFDAECDRLVAAVCDAGLAPDRRERAWQELMGRVGPHVEAWSRRSPILRQARLTGPDEARTVLVTVLERLADDDFANLRGYLARRPPPAGEGDLVDTIARVCDAADDAGGDTRLEAWLRTLTRYLERDHVRRRLGGGGGHKRGVTTDAAPLPTSGIAGERPPVTDTLAMAKVVAEVRAYMATFPSTMRIALERWLDDTGFDDIARELALPDAGRARALVRAGQARLRERFRDRVPAMFAA